MADYDHQTVQNGAYTWRFDGSDDGVTLDVVRIYGTKSQPALLSEALTAFATGLGLALVVHDEHFAASQASYADSRVDLFIIDLTDLGGLVLRWTPGTLDDEPVLYQSEVYSPRPVEIKGLEWNGRGSLPQPKLTVGNVEGLVTGLVIGFGDMVGGTVTRLTTFRKFLDGQPAADKDAHFDPEIYRIDRKSRHDDEEVEFTLASIIDQQDAKLPARQCLRDACTLLYRRFDADTQTFDYTKATCPYTGTLYFKRTGAATGNASEDSCGKRFSDCVNRFQSDPLPYNGFPGMALAPR